MPDIAQLARYSLSLAAQERRRAETAPSEMERLKRLEMARLFEARAIRKASKVGRLIDRERIGLLRGNGSARGQRHPAARSRRVAPIAIPFGSAPVRHDRPRRQAPAGGHAATAEIGGVRGKQLRCRYVALSLRLTAFVFSAAFLVGMSLKG
jgi:hypothetical protein